MALFISLCGHRLQICAIVFDISEPSGVQQLEEEDKQTIFKLIDKMLTNKKFKDFFAKNLATL